MKIQVLRLPSKVNLLYLKNDKQEILRNMKPLGRCREISCENPNDISNNRLSVQNDRITRYASPNRFDSRAVPCSFLDSYRSYRSPQKNETNFNRSKFRSSMQTSLSSYAVPYTKEHAFDKSIPKFTAQNPESVVTSNVKFCEKNISSLIGKERSTGIPPARYESTGPCISSSRQCLTNVVKAPNNSLSNTTNCNSNSLIKHFNETSSPHNISSTAHRTLPPYSLHHHHYYYSYVSHENQPQPQQQQPQAQSQHQCYSFHRGSTNHAVTSSLSHPEISKANLLPNRYSVIPQTTLNNNNNDNNSNNNYNNTVYNVSNMINQSKCIIPPSLTDYSISKDNFEKQMNQDNSLVNHTTVECTNSYENSSSNKFCSSNYDQCDNTQNNNNKTGDNTTTMVNSTNNNNYNAQTHKQANYPFKGNSFRSVKNSHKNRIRHISKQQEQQTNTLLNDGNESNLKPEIKLIDSRPRTRLYIQSGTKTHTKTMTLRKDLITDDSLSEQELNRTGFISLPDRRSSSSTTRKGVHKLPTSPSMPLPSETPSVRWIYNVNLSEMDYSSEPYSICTSLVECKQTDTDTVDSQNDPDLTDKLDYIASEIGLLHHKNYMRREHSQSPQWDINGLLSTINPCSESSLPKVDLDHFVSQGTPTIVSNPASISSLTNDTIALQTNSTSSTSPKITDSRCRSHFSRVDAALVANNNNNNNNKDTPQSRPSSTGSKIFKQFLRHISPKLRRSFSGFSNRRKSETRKPHETDIPTDSLNQSTSAFERCKSDRHYSKSFLWLIPRCSSRSKENKEKGKEKIVAEGDQTSTVCPLNVDTHSHKTISPVAVIDDSCMSDSSITPIVKNSHESKQQFSSSSQSTSSHYQSHLRCSRYQNGYNSSNNNEHHSHQHTRPLSIALPIDNERNETSFDSWYSGVQSHRRCQTEFSPRYKDFATSASADYSGPIYLNAALNAFGYGCKPEWKQFCVSPSARRLAHAKQSLRMRQIKRNSLDTELYTDISTGDTNESFNNNTKHVMNNDQCKETTSFHHENESDCTNGENSVESKPKQTLGYYCDNDKKKGSLSSDKKSAENLEISADGDKDKSNLTDSEQDLKVSVQHLKKYNESVSDETAQVGGSICSETGESIEQFNELDKQNVDNKSKEKFSDVISAIPSRTPPIKRRNTALAIKAKAARLRQPLNTFLPKGIIGRRDKLTTALYKAGELIGQSEITQSTNKKELTTLYESEHSPTEQENNNNNKITIDPHFSLPISPSVSTSQSFSEDGERIKKLSSSSNDVHNRVEISNNPSDWIEYVKNPEINRSDLELSMSDDVDFVFNLLKNVQTFECQLVNVISMAKSELNKDTDSGEGKVSSMTSDGQHGTPVTTTTSNPVNNDELLTGIGHAQMLISGNLTTLRKLCKVYLEANSQVKKRQSIDYIPLKSDLEGYWDLILIQYRRFESQFPQLCDWISKDFRNELQNFVEKSVGYQSVHTSEVESSKQLDNETTRSPRKDINTAASNKQKQSPGKHIHSNKTTQLRNAARDRIANARKKMKEKSHSENDANTNDKIETESTNVKTSGNSLFYTIE
ncbi:unnamed protein product [Trichobilharzia szidati]|nr:unnamed protein product [Trichobilharzia szidati]